MYSQLLTQLQIEIEQELGLALKPLIELVDIFEPEYSLSTKDPFSMHLVKEHSKIDSLPIIKLRMKKEFSSLPSNIQGTLLKGIILNALREHVASQGSFSKIILT